MIRADNILAVPENPPSTVTHVARSCASSVRCCCATKKRSYSANSISIARENHSGSFGISLRELASTARRAKSSFGKIP